MKYQMRDLQALACTVANGGLKRMVAIDRTAILDLLGVNIKDNRDAEYGTGYITFDDTALGKIFAQTGTTYDNAFHVNIKKNTLSIQSEKQDDDSWQNTITPLQVAGADRDVHAIVQSMLDNDMAYLVEDRNNTVYFLGFYAPVVLSAGSYNSGTTVTDANGYELTLMERNPECLFEAADDTDNHKNLAGNEVYKKFWGEA